MGQKTFTPQEKAQVALAALEGEKTIAQISSEHEVHVTQVNAWKKIAKENLAELFKDNKKKEVQKEFENQKKVDELHRVIGQRDVELEWLKKKSTIFART